MLNYIKAELYRAAHHKSTYLVSGILLALAAVFTAVWQGRLTFPGMADLLSATMPVGLSMAAVVDVVVVSGAHRLGVLKNEVEFGIPRLRIYLGKLIAAFVLSALLCVLVMGGFLWLSRLLSPPGTDEETRGSMAVLGYVTAASLPLWLGALGVTHALFLGLKSEVLSAFLAVYLLLLGEPVTAVLATINSDVISAPAKAVRSVMLIDPFWQFEGRLTWRLMAQSWAIGLGWLLVSTGAGLRAFCRAEVK